MCGEVGSLTHILSGCRVALAQGRYTWRHDQVLKEIASFVDEKRRASNAEPKEERQGGIRFVKQGEKKIGKTEKTSPRSYLDGASDWTLSVDLNGRLKFPTKVADTNLRPDMVLMPGSSRRVGIVELTVPSENRVEVS